MTADLAFSTDSPPEYIGSAPSLLDVFVLRAEARAILYEACVYDLHETVDVLQADAERCGLIDEIGQDAVQEILRDVFRAVRNMQCSDIMSTNSARATTTHHSRQDPLPISTIRAAEYLVQLGNRQRLRDWLTKRSRVERKALRKYFIHKNKRRNG